jgi:pheromone shutdown-related protein TraB
VSHENQIELQLNGRQFLLVGTAHVGQDSVDEVKKAIEAWRPDHVCIELDAGRLNSLRDPHLWEKIDIGRVIRQGQGLMMLANLVLAGFQKRAGANLGSAAGMDMLAAVSTAEEMQIPYSLIDREVGVTLRRAWAKSGFWGQQKLLAALVSSAFDQTPMKKEEIEQLKKGSGIDKMMEELAKELPRAKKVLIDERDALLALGAWEAAGSRVLCVVGAGHLAGMKRHLESFAQGEVLPNREELTHVPPPGFLSRWAAWIVPAALLGLMVYGLYAQGWEGFLKLLGTWSLWTGGGAALGALIALAHPLTILVGFLSAPITALHPLLGVGMFTGLTELYFSKPKVKDFQNLQEDITSLKGLYTNRITHILIVMLFSSLGVILGTIMTGTSWFNLLVR